MGLIKVPKERLEHLWLLVYLVVAVLALRLVDIQLFQHSRFLAAAERNRTQVLIQNAPRGRVITKDGAIVATNKPTFSLVFLPAASGETGYFDKLAGDFAGLLGNDKLEILNIMQQASRHGRPVRLAENLSAREMFSLSELKALYPGIELVVETKRAYPYGSMLSHLLGYMGKMSRPEWLAYRKDGYRFDDRIGKTGIEKIFEKYLKGRDGGIYLEIDFRGRLAGVLARQKWEPGSDVRLTVDFRAQEAAELGLRNSLTQKGAVVAINPQNGDILAMASAPDFEPAMFIEKSSSSVRAKLPEFNYAIQGQYAPASTFKIIVGAAALEAGYLKPGDRYFCPGYYDTGSRRFQCWEKKGHGSLDFIQGMAHSCDVYFYNVAVKMGPSAIEKYEMGFRLGMPTGVPLPGEVAGRVFGPRQRAQQRSYWFMGDTLNLSIGQGELLVTPIQMAQVIAAVANRGSFWRPQFAEQIVDNSGKPLFRKKVELLSRVNLGDTTWDILWQALREVVTAGTAAGINDRDLELYGKTGTAQTSRGDENAWFVAFARRDGKAPDIAVAVMVQHGKHGSSAAAPIARNVIRAYYRLDEKKNRADAQARQSVGVSTGAITAGAGLLEKKPVKQGAATVNPSGGPVPAAPDPAPVKSTGPAGTSFSPARVSGPKWDRQ
ncbi:MAG: penicillin-binding protein 2 [Elusimicrobiaceae bacterium]|nr:penicillin-binding protein 2 [Elusimicrobiaceae bacterium]